MLNHFNHTHNSKLKLIVIKQWNWQLLQLKDFYQKRLIRLSRYRKVSKNPFVIALYCISFSDVDLACTTQLAIGNQTSLICYMFFSLIPWNRFYIITKIFSKFNFIIEIYCFCFTSTRMLIISNTLYCTLLCCSVPHSTSSLDGTWNCCFQCL